MKILVVDDSMLARKLVIKTLKNTIEDIDVITQASNGQEAIDIYRETPQDLVFLDLTMPVMDGFEALACLREMDSSAKIVIVSADVQKKAKDTVLKLGAIDFIRKPIDDKKIHHILRLIK